MLLNYLTIASRIIKKQPVYSIINVLGLALSLACSILILLWVKNEIDFDDFHKNRATVYQVMENQIYSDGDVFTYDATPFPLAYELKEQIPEVEYSCRTSWVERLIFDYNNQTLFEEGVYVDSSFLEIFSFPILYGDEDKPLPDESSIEISKVVADRYFNGENPIGKVVRINNKLDLKISTIFSVPQNSSLQFDILLPFSLYLQDVGDTDQWNYNSIPTYVKLYNNDSEGTVNDKIEDIIKKYDKESLVKLFLFPMTDWRLFSNFENGKQSGGRINYVISFSLVAIFILTIGCINFMNLSTAQSAVRYKEIGVRKVMGAARGSIMWQFLLESLLLSFIALLIALMIVHIGIPYFNELMRSNINIDYTDNTILAALVIATIFTGVVSGTYPSWFLSSLKPNLVLKGSLYSVWGGAGLRRSLVIVQFGLSLLLISATLTINDQIKYIRSKNLGFNKQNVIYFSRQNGSLKNFETFRNELLLNPGIQFVSQASSTPMELNGSGGAEWDGKPENLNVLFQRLDCDHDFIPTMGMEIVVGRNFSRDFSDSANFIITEHAANVMGINDPIGKPLQFFDCKGKIIGVVKDFHNTNLHDPIEPMILTFKSGDLWGIFVKYMPGRTKEALEHIQNTYKKFEPDIPLEYNFIERRFENDYATDIVMGNLSFGFTLVAILVSCLGLLGLTLFASEKRTKEIGVRRVFGATTSNMIILLCYDFVKPILIAVILFSPLAYYIMQKVLQQYSFHTELNSSSLFIGSIVLILLAITTVSYHAITTSNRNPIEALRNE